MSVLDYLKGTGLPCNVTLYYVDEDFDRTWDRGVHINLNKIPKDIIKGEKDYYIKVKVGDFHKFSFQSVRPFNNQSEFNYLERMLFQYYEEEMNNYKRWTRFNDILSDTSPPKLI